MLRFTDPAGDQSLLSPATVHRFTAQAGTEVSLQNDSDRDCAEYLQIWFEASREAAGSDFESQISEIENRDQTLICIASGQEHSEGLDLHEDAAVYLSRLRPSENLIFETLLSRRVFLFVMKGLVRADEHRLQDFDSAMVWKETSITLSAQERCTLLLIDLE
jgi:redox-sensitive bicupin YhaK (pirin superfamily)